MYSLYQGLEANAFVKWFISNIVTGQALEVIHYFSFFIIVGSMFSVDLRLLELTGKSLSVRQIADRAFPAIWIALIFNVFTGFFMFAGSATMYYTNGWFYFKLAATLACVLSTILIQKNVSGWDRPKVPMVAKIVAAVSILLWLGTIVIAVEVPAITGVG